MVAVLSFSSFCPSLELRMVIGIILSPAVEISDAFVLEDVVMMVFSSIMLGAPLLFYAKMCL